MMPVAKLPYVGDNGHPWKCLILAAGGVVDNQQQNPVRRMGRRGWTLPHLQGGIAELGAERSSRFALQIDSAPWKSGLRLK